VVIIHFLISGFKATIRLKHLTKGLLVSAVLSGRSNSNGAPHPSSDGDNVAILFPFGREMCVHCGTTYGTEKHSEHVCRVLAREKWLRSLQPIEVRYSVDA
jgi:hypothetical protein